MAEIHLLDNVLINKIAAGEVIERPASVVKELVENSIDAGATAITIEIKDGGINYIRITDNGKGIPAGQIKTAFLRHATSKINDFNDLMSILTLGFRGEALSSIASVSQVEMVTKTKDDELATKIELSGGKVLNEEKIAGNNGTSFTMKNLFFNTPARRKFLKKPATESGYISDMVNKIALGHPHISFKFINNNSVVLHTSGNNDIKTAVFYVYGKDTAKKMLPISKSKNSFSINGLIGKPELNRGNRSYENFFVNGRYIKSTIVQRAVEDAYQGRLMVGKFPVFVIDLTVPANSVDVNVHPAKLEVRFSDEDFIYNLIKNAIEDVLKNQELIPSVQWDNNVKNTEKTEEIAENIIEVSSEKELENQDNKKKSIEELEALLLAEGEEEVNYSEKDYTEKKGKMPIFVREDAEEKTEGYQNLLDFEEPKPTTQTDTKKEEKKESQEKKQVKRFDEIEVEDNKPKRFFNNYKIVGQIFNTYWIVEQDNSMYMIDQHAAHERVIYEELIGKVKNQQVISQRMLQSTAVNLSLQEMQVVRDNIELFERFGFELEEFGTNTYAIRSVPYIFKTPVSAGFFIELVDLLSDNKSIQNIYETRLDAIATMSCKAAIKGNDKLSFIEAKALIEKVLKLENPFSCPHGRPTIIEMSKYEIEKKFKRIQN